jgi:purine-binding chemotaxis protein CheW
MIDVANDIKSYLSFKVGEEMFAINAKHIHSIIEQIPITKVPQMPEFILGIINLREQAIPVVDTRVQFGMPPSTVTENTCIIIVEFDLNGNNLLIGCLVDAVSEVIEIEKERIFATPDIGGRYRSELISGVIRNQKGFTMLLNIHELFASDNLTSLNS